PAAGMSESLARGRDVSVARTERDRCRSRACRRRFAVCRHEDKRGNQDADHRFHELVLCAERHFFLLSVIEAGAFSPIVTILRLDGFAIALPSARASPYPGHRVQSTECPG